MRAKIHKIFINSYINLKMRCKIVRIKMRFQKIKFNNQKAKLHKVKTN